jgi:uncharacterized membrane protein YcfT
MAYLPKDIPSLQFYMSKILTANLTSYDLLKAFAVITMFIDHAGLYFFPDQEWLRIIGRLSFPVWFFLIGFAQTRHIPAVLIAGALLVVIASYVTGSGMFPLNALVSIIAIRLILDWCMTPVMEGRRSLWAMALILLLLVIPSYVVTEYGTLGLIMAIFGFLVRWKDVLKEEWMLPGFALFALVSYVVLQQLIFGMDVPQMLVLFGGMAIMTKILYSFKDVEYPKLSSDLPRPLMQLLQVMGRYTLEIYVVHVIAFKLAALALGIGGAWFTWSWLPPS